MDQHKETDQTNASKPIKEVDLSEQSSALPGGIDKQAAATEAILKDFQAEVASTPGFRSGSARAPGHYMSAVELTSWLQVPAILNQLQNEGVEKLRIIFPAPTANTFVSSEHVADFVKEQHQISNFIKENHSKPIEEIKKLLIEKIESSFSLGVLKSRSPVGDSVTASAWVDASLLSSENSRSLSVSTLFPIGQKSLKAETTTDPLALSLLESALKERPSTITIPSTNQQKLEELAQLFSSLVQDGGRLHDHSDVLLSKTKVWVGPYVSKLNTTMEVHAPCPEVKEYSLREFIDTYLPKGQRPSLSSEAPTSPLDAPGVKAPLAAGAAVPGVPSDPSEHDKAPAIDAPLSTERQKREETPPLLDADSTRGVDNASFAGTNESANPLPPPDNAHHATHLDSHLAASSPDELILHVERRVDSQAATDSPLEETSLPPRPDEIELIEPIDPMVTIDLERYLIGSEGNPEEAIESARRRSNRRFYDTAVVETPKRKPELPEEKNHDGGLA